MNKSKRRVHPYVAIQNHVLREGFYVDCQNDVCGRDCNTCMSFFWGQGNNVPTKCVPGCVPIEAMIKTKKGRDGTTALSDSDLKLLQDTLDANTPPKSGTDDPDNPCSVVRGCWNFDSCQKCQEFYWEAAPTICLPGCEYE